MNATVADDLRAHHLRMNPETFIARRDLLRKQARELLTQERRARIRRRVARFLLPWAGWILARGRFSRRRSLTLDRIIQGAEK